MEHTALTFENLGPEVAPFIWIPACAGTSKGNVMCVKVGSMKYMGWNGKPQELQIGKTHVLEQTLVMRCVVLCCGEVKVGMVFC